MSLPHSNAGAVGILGLQAGEDVNAFRQFEAILLMAHAEGRQCVASATKKREPDDLVSMGLAVAAFSLIGASTFTVSADLNALKPKTLTRFRKFQEILLMAHKRGQEFAMAWTAEDSATGAGAQ